MKAELEQLRYHENWVNELIDAPLTFESHNFWSNCWIFKFHTFLETGSQDLSRVVKINPHLKGCYLVKRTRAIKGPKHLQTRKKEKRFWVLLCAWTFFAHFLSLPNTSLHIKTHKKHIQVSWFFLLHQKYKVLFLYPIFFSLVLHFGSGV